MASPLTMGGPSGNGWMGPAASQQQSGPAVPSEAEEVGLQVRSMGLKVHYTFDKDSRVNCLARWPQTLQVQAIPVDERNWIGVVDLRVCVQAVAQCSPELLAQSELDYAIYAFDYSEPDTPLVGQGMLSWALQTSSSSSPPPLDDGSSKLVTGRVTKNMLAIFGNGVRETLEVKLKLTEVARMGRLDNASNGGGDASQSQARNAPTPTDTTEWNSFLQANPALGRSASISTMQSPSLAPARPDMSGFQPNLAVGPSASFETNVRSMPGAASRPGSRPGSRQSSVGPSYLPVKGGPPPLLAPKPASSAFATGSPPATSAAHEGPVTASTPPAEFAPSREAGSRPSRPSSRSSRSRQPTGRPRGRPRKRQPTDGNTSAAEEVPTDADADDAHKKKRAKITKADYPVRTSLDVPPESLRVAASTSGSLRTLRPIMAASTPGGEGNGAPGSHLQEFPRAPTPVPSGGGPPGQHQMRKMMAQKSRRDSLVDFDSSTFQDQMYARSVDARSPTDSIAPSPENYTPEDSPADIGSSPPVPRSTTYVPQSSPAPSSPILPPMPRPQPDSGFMSGGMDDLFDDDDCLNDNMPPPPTPQEPAVPTPTLPYSQPLPTSDALTVGQPPVESTNAASHNPRPSRTSSQPPSRKASSRSNEQFPFLPMNPGPPELLPVTSIYNPPSQHRSRTAKGHGSASTSGKAAAATLTRSHSEPVPVAQQKQQHKSQPASRDLPLPSEADLPAAASLPTSAEVDLLPLELPRATPGSKMSIDVPEDMTELAKLLGTVDGRQTLSETMTATSKSAPASASSSLETTQSPPAQSALPQQPTEEVSNPTGGAVTSTSRTAAIPASDPPSLPPLMLPSLPPPTAFSEAPCPPSDVEQPSGRLNKNFVRKAAIRERLQKAIESGETPPYCQNCGAIETPTWRKMWTQDHDGEPRYVEFSEKPGQVTAIDILERNEEGKPIKYRLVKKTLGSTEDNKLWTQMLLCNPCGIWLGKFKSHRPSDRWDKDASRLNQPRRKGGSRGGSKKARTKSDPQLQPTSEAYFTTDLIGPEDISIVTVPASENDHFTAPMAPMDSQPDSFDFSLPLPAPAPAPAAVVAITETAAEPKALEPKATVDTTDLTELQQAFQAGSNRGPASSGGSASRHRLGSTHSRGSGTANSPISVDDHFGTTRRLLFPSPRKDGVPKVLGELTANILPTVASDKKDDRGDENSESSGQKRGNEKVATCDQDDMTDLFGTPPPVTRPSTPPPRSGGNGSSVAASSGPFKTPTRPTPNHRPITRSVSKSIRSGVSYPKSPTEGLMLLQRTPSKTPRSVSNSARKRRMASMTPGKQQNLIAPFHLDGVAFDTPFTSTLNQLLSEANDFMTGSPSHGLTDLDLTSLANLDSDGLTAGFNGSTAGIDFGSYLDTDLVMPSSSPLLGRKSARRQQHVAFGEALAFEASESMWTDFSEAIQGDEVAAESL